MSDESISLDMEPKSDDSFTWRREAADWARVLFDGIDDAIFVHDLKGRILDANPAACRRLGYTREELLNLTTADIDDPEFAKGFQERLQQQMRDGHMRFVGKHRTKDGRTILVDINTSTIEFYGRPCILAVMRDITNQVRVERSLRESQAFYHSLVESIPQNLFRKDREGRVTFANQRYCKLLGKSLNELIGKTDFDLFPRHLAEKYVADDRKVLETGKPLQLVEEHVTPDGRKLYVEVIKTPIYDSRGRIIGTQGLFWDVTDRVLAESRLADSERRYRQLTEATLDAIIVADAKGRIALFNPAAQRLFGYTPEEVIGQSVTVLMPEKYRADHEQGLRRYLDTHTGKIIGKPVELEGLRKDGSVFPIEIALTVLTPDSQRPDRINFLAAIRDLTERNRMRSVVVQNEKLASIGLLSAGVAHEINNPLAFVANNLAVIDRDIRGLMELLDCYDASHEVLAEAKPDLLERLRAKAEEIDLEYIRDNFDRLLTRTREGVERVAKIVQSLRSLARTSKPVPQEISLGDLFDSSLEIIRSRLRRLNILVECHLDNLPQVRCVPTQIGQVFLNLLVNAMHAIEAAKPEQGLITIAAQANDSEIRIDVSDNGCGIPQEQLDRIFDPFFTTKDVGEGTGLGLSICHNIITGHNGRIEVESEVGRGTTFHIYLPIQGV